MFELNFVIVCDNAFLAKETNSLNIMGIFDRIDVKKFPTTYPRLMIVTNMSGDIGDYDQFIIIRNKETNEKVAKLEGKLKIQTLKQKAQFLATFFNIGFKIAGEYEVEVYINNKLQDLTTTFYVEQRQ